MRSLFDAPAISVGELCRRIKHALDAAFPDRVRVIGEISDCTVATSGHAYFSLKDRQGLVKCVCFRTTIAAMDVSFPLPDGMAVEVLGRVTAYKERSQFQIVVDDVVPVGRGALYRKFELLKEKLFREGLFDDSRKRPIPSFVRNVAIVTSRGAAALQDFLTTCRRRGAHITVTLVHSAVQGEAAGIQLAGAIRFAGTLAVDVVVVTRGGGSIEDLWAFNTESVARAIAACAKPVISAVGHESDVSIADFVADRRAATPTAAAEMVSPDRSKLLRALADYERRMVRSLLRVSGEARRRYVRARRDLEYAPQAMVDEPAQRLDDLESRLRSADPRKRTKDLRRRIAAAGRRLRVAGARAFVEAHALIGEIEERQRLALAKSIVGKLNRCDVAAARLGALGPGATLGRGYAIVFGVRGAILTDSAGAEIGHPLDITLRRGNVQAQVTGTKERHGQEFFEEKD
jgi:exodeoxyribonuclease VII large subunit